MHYAQVLTYGIEGKPAERLQHLAQEHGFWLREVRHLKTCLNLLRRAGPGILVLKLGRDLERELTLLERVTWLFPETVTLVVGESDHPQLTGLAWELGAKFVLVPPQPLELLSELILRLLPPSRRFGEPGTEVPGV